MLNKGFFEIFSLLIFSLFPFLLLNSSITSIVYVILILFFGIVFIIENIVKKSNTLKGSNDIENRFNKKLRYSEIMYIYISLLSAFIGCQKEDKVISLIFLLFSVIFIANLLIKRFMRR